jgi:hypothetical protein
MEQPRDVQEFFIEETTGISKIKNYLLKVAKKL